MSDPVNGLLWSFAGFVIGLLVGYVVRGFIVARARTRPAEPAAPAAARGPKQPGWFDRYGRPAVGLLILALVAYTVYQQNTVAAAQRDYAHCQAAADHAFQQALADRSAASKGLNDATATQNDAQRTFLVAIAVPGATLAQRTDAYRAYQASLDAQHVALQQLAQAQAAHPLVVTDCDGN